MKNPNLFESPYMASGVAQKREPYACSGNASFCPSGGNSCDNYTPDSGCHVGNAIVTGVGTIAAVITIVDMFPGPVVPG